jgi:hypothetical protein
VRPGESPGGSAFCICPEARTALRSLLRSTAARVPYAGQHVFECGVMWSFIAFGQHPLPGYPDAYVTPPTFAVQYTEANMTNIPADDGMQWPHGASSWMSRAVATLCDGLPRQRFMEAPSRFGGFSVECSAATPPRDLPCNTAWTSCEPLLIVIAVQLSTP